MERLKLESRREYLRTYPRLCAHIVAESLGYATPSLAASILKDAREGNDNYCEWILTCYDGDSRPAVEKAIRNRHHHHGPMASYELALRIVRRELATGQGPLLASWF